MDASLTFKDLVSQFDTELLIPLHQDCHHVYKSGQPDAELLIPLHQDCVIMFIDQVSQFDTCPHYVKTMSSCL